MPLNQPIIQTLTIQPTSQLTIHSTSKQTNHLSSLVDMHHPGLTNHASNQLKYNQQAHQLVNHQQPISQPKQAGDQPTEAS